MIVCVCRSVSDKTLRALTAAGIQTVDEVKKACGAGTDCRKCRPMLLRLLEETAEKPYYGSTLSPYVCPGGRTYEGP
jgi:bacterioferritin-associated ferredoxin